jgi:hypothetical protein
MSFVDEVETKSEESPTKVRSRLFIRRQPPHHPISSTHMVLMLMHMLICLSYLSFTLKSFGMCCCRSIVVDAWQAMQKMTILYRLDILLRFVACSRVGRTEICMFAPTMDCAYCCFVLMHAFFHWKATINILILRRRRRRQQPRTTTRTQTCFVLTRTQLLTCSSQFGLSLFLCISFSQVLCSLQQSRLPLQVTTCIVKSIRMMHAS